MADEQVSAIEAVIARNKFYKDSYRLVTIALMACVLILFMLIGTIIYLINHPPAPRYFATTNDGRIMQIVPLEQPNLTQSQLLQWANTAAIAAYTYSFSNWRKQLQALSDYFTPEGWQQFITALNASNNLDAVRSKKLIVSAETTGPAVLVKEGLFHDRYTWKVQVPLLVTYQGGSGDSQFTQQSLLITMVITRLPTLTSMRGVGVIQLIAHEQ